MLINEKEQMHLYTKMYQILNSILQYCVNVTDLIVFILYLCNYNGANCIALNSGSLSCDQSFGFQEKKSGLCNWNMALFSMGDFFILSEICMLNSRKTQDLVNGNSRNELCQRSNELWNTRKMFFRNEIKKMKYFNDEFLSNAQFTLQIL